MRTRRNCLHTIQSPKPEAALVDRTGHEQDTGQSSSYRWNQCLRIGSGIIGSGEADESRGWYCPDCGAPVDLGAGDDVPSCCSRCGSCEAAVWQEGT